MLFITFLILIFVINTKCNDESIVQTYKLDEHRHWSDKDILNIFIICNLL
jgi:hypothetical protein